MSTRIKAVQGSNQTCEGLESPAFTHGEHINEHSQAAIAAHPAPDRDGVVTIEQKRTGKLFSRKRFATGKSYAMACRFTFHMRNCYDAWSFMGLKV